MKQVAIHESLQQRMSRGAVNYARADRSDPFAYDRALSHMHMHISGVRHSNNGDREDAFYDAEPFEERRKFRRADGSLVEFSETVYRNIRRP